MKKGKIAPILLSVIIGAIFLFSAWSKTDPIQYFEYVISSQLHLKQTTAAWMARFFIGLEATLGLLLIINIFGYRRWTLKACLALLILFSIHLLYLLFTQGNDVNCGCMGTVAPMSPAMSLLKNAGLVAGIIVLLKYHKDEDSKLLQIATFPVALLITSLPYFLLPIKKQGHMPLSKLYQSQESAPPVVELRKGKHILCFMSLSCKHCRDAARILAKMKKNNASLPIYFALSAGDSSTRNERFADFMSDTKATNIPYHFLSPNDFTDMIMISGSDGIPVLLWMEDTTIIRKLYVPDLNQKEMEIWIKNK